MLFALLLGACSNNGPSESAAPEAADTAPQSEIWRFAIEEVEGSVQDSYAREFKRRIEERSNGRIEVAVYPYGTLGTSSQLTELAQSGAIELIFASAGHLADLIPEIGVFTLHFILSENDQVNREAFSDPELHALLNPLYRDEDLELLDVVAEGWMVWSGNKALRTPSDFRGFKIRTMTSPILVESYRAYGASPTPLPYSEVYSGLQLGQIDGQVNPVFAIEEMSFYEEQSVLTSARHAQFVATVVASQRWFDSLNAEDQRMVREVRDELVEWTDAVQIDLNTERLEQILDAGGTEWVELSEAERDAFRTASLDVRDRFVERTGETGQRLLETLLERIEQLEAERDS